MNEVHQLGDYPLLPRNKRRPNRRSCPDRSAYAGVQPLPINNEKAPLRVALAIADEQDARVPGGQPRARIYALKRVKTRGQPFPVKGKNKNQRERLENAFLVMARTRRFTSEPRLPV